MQCVILAAYIKGELHTMIEGERCFFQEIKNNYFDISSNIKLYIYAKSFCTSIIVEVESNETIFGSY